MTQLLIILILLGCHITGKSQIYAGSDGFTFKYVEPKERYDTIRCHIVYANIFTKEVEFIQGYEIRKIVSYYGQVPCPENRGGCMVLHYGWTDDIDCLRYESPEYIPIEQKGIIKAIPIGQ